MNVHNNGYSFDFASYGQGNNFLLNLPTTATHTLDSADILDGTPTPFQPAGNTSQDPSSIQQFLQQFVQQFLQQILGPLQKLLGGDKTGASQHPAPSGNTAPIDDPGASQGGSVQTAGGAGETSSTRSIGDIPVDGGGKNTITVKNTSDKEQSYALFTNPGPGQTSSFGLPNGFVTLKPGESANFKLPDQHSGYVQQMNNYTEADYKAGKAPAADNFKASRAEYTFNADGSLFFNASNIDGYNSALKMTSEDQVAGSSESVLAQIEKTNPNLISVVGGQKVVEGSQFFTHDTNIEARNALDKYLNRNNNPDDLNGNTTTYVMPNDDKAMRMSRSNDLTLEFGNA